MTKLLTVYIGVLLLAMLFSSQVHAQNATIKSHVTNVTEADLTSSTMTNVTTTNVTTTNVTTTTISIPQGASVSLQSSAFTLLIPVVGSLLQGRF